KPNAGWITEEAAVEASISSATSVYESPNRSLKYGSSAGTDPPAKSVARWPPESSAIARLSTSARTAPRVSVRPRGPYLGGVDGGRDAAGAGREGEGQPADRRRARDPRRRRVDSLDRVALGVGDPHRSRAGDDADRVEADPRDGGRDGVELRVDAAHGAGVAVQNPDGAAAERDADRVRRARAAPRREQD